jgi:hypothetical protein
MRSAVCSPAMWGWLRLASSLISRMKRSANSGASARLGRSTFKASLRSEMTFRTL